MSTTDGETVPETSQQNESVGQTFDRYKLLEKIGEGGFGVVYVAEQKEPVKRRVALKIIKLGMDTRQVVARFEAERQALALSCAVVDRRVCINSTAWLIGIAVGRTDCPR